MIPKKIYYTWFGRTPLPKKLQKFLSTWEKHCPDYEIIEINETNFDVKQHHFTENAYNAKKFAFVSDYARLKTIYDYGGIYLDTDVEVLKSLDELLGHESFFGVEQSNNLINTGLGFGAKKNSPVIKKMLQIYDVVNYSSDKLEHIACPILNTRVLKQLGYTYKNEPVNYELFTVYPSEYFDPLNTIEAKNLITNNTYTIHHYSSSWQSPKIKIKKKIIQVLGTDRFITFRKLLNRL